MSTKQRSPTQHHASCTESNKELVFHCSQCGLIEPAPDMVKREESVSMSAWTETDQQRVRADRDRDRLAAENARLRKALELAANELKMARYFNAEKQARAALAKETP